VCDGEFCLLLFVFVVLISLFCYYGGFFFAYFSGGVFSVFLVL